MEGRKSSYQFPPIPWLIQCSLPRVPYLPSGFPAKIEVSFFRISYPTLIHPFLLYPPNFLILSKAAVPPVFGLSKLLYLLSLVSQNCCTFCLWSLKAAVPPVFDLSKLLYLLSLVSQNCCTSCLWSLKAAVPSVFGLSKLLYLLSLVSQNCCTFCLWSLKAAVSPLFGLSDKLI